MLLGLVFQNVAQSVPIDELDKKGFFPNDNRDMGEAFTGGIKGKDALGITITRREEDEDGEGNFDDSPVGMMTQISLLFQREINNLKRDTSALGARFGLTIFLAVLIGVIFLDVGESNLSVVSVS